MSVRCRLTALLPSPCTPTTLAAAATINLCTPSNAHPRATFLTYNLTASFKVTT